MMQALRDQLTRIGQAFKPQVEAVLPVAEEAWSENSAIYTLADFEKYNPDQLIRRKGFAIYRKMMTDEQVKAVVKFKRDAITSRDFFFELDPKKHGITQEEADRRIEVNEAIIDQMKGSFVDVLNNIMSSMYNGFSMNEKVFQQIEYDSVTWWGLKRVKIKPFDTFYFHVDDYGNIEKVTQKVNGKNQEVSIEKFIHFVHNPDVDEHYGQSELREAYRAWFSKDKIIKFRNIWLERHAGGFRWVQPLEDKTFVPGSAEFTALQDVLRRTQVATSAIFPSTVKVNVSYPANQVAFKEAIEDNDLAIARALLVPNLMGITPAGQTGSFSQSDTQMEAFFWTLDVDADRLEDAMNEQLFDELNEVNFGDTAGPRFKLKPVSEKKKLAVIKLWKDLVSGKAVQHTDTDEAHIRKVLEFPEAGEEIKAPTTPGQQGGLPGDGLDPNINDDDPDPSVKKEPGADGEGEETIAGRGLITITAFQKALKRVDFAVIGKNSETVVEVGTKKTGVVMGKLVADIVTKIKRDSLGTGDGDPKLLAKLRFDSSLVQKMRRATRSYLRQGWDLGTKHAQIEIDKAQSTEFKVKLERLEFIEEKFFDLKSFAITGNLTDQTMAIIKNILLSGAKTGKSITEVITLIYTELSSTGLLSLEDAKEALGAALGVEFPDARLNTIVRTNTFEAINEARYAYFTDPSLGGFVQALEYSAILDTRTTQICQHLDGKVHSADSEVWSSYRPPNHYNCRSLLVPVTSGDTWSEDDQPTVDPQKGFK